LRANPASTASASSALFWQSVDGILNQFAEQYGGVEPARSILDRGISSSGAASNRSDGTVAAAERTACRVLRARTGRASSGRTATSRRPPFRMVFGGYSVTAGRGNLFSER
jgi:hypothetical protein